MTIYVGETIDVIAQAVDPLTGASIIDAVGAVLFYAPGKNPSKVPADRTPDFGPISMSYQADIINNGSSVTGAYVAFQDTTGWVAGKWSYKVTLTSSYDTWEYGTFTLVA